MQPVCCINYFMIWSEKSVTFKYCYAELFYANIQASICLSKCASFISVSKQHVYQVYLFLHFTVILKYELAGEQIAACLLELSQLTSCGEAGSDTSAYLHKLWPLKEYWLLRTMLHCLANVAIDRLSLARLRSYYGSPLLLQLTLNLHALAEQPVSVELILLWCQCNTLLTRFIIREMFATLWSDWASVGILFCW